MDSTTFEQWVLFFWNFSLFPPLNLVATNKLWSKKLVDFIRSFTVETVETGKRTEVSLRFASRHIIDFVSFDQGVHTWRCASKRNGLNLALTVVLRKFVCTWMLIYPVCVSAIAAVPPLLRRRIPQLVYTYFLPPSTLYQKGAETIVIVPATYSLDPWNATRIP